MNEKLMCPIWDRLQHFNELPITQSAAYTKTWMIHVHHVYLVLEKWTEKRDELIYRLRK